MRYVALLALLVSVAAGQAAAQTASLEHQLVASPLTVRPVVELYTSQGCSSCPAADALLGRLAKRDDIIALSFSVDYWDYLGWKDTLANPKFSERQRAYAQARGDGEIYTPQVVVNGVSHVNGGEENLISRAIEKTSKPLASVYVPIRLTKDNDKLVIEAGAAPSGTVAKDATLWLAVIAKSVEVPIRRGENKDKTITYYNVVRELTPIGMWNGKSMTVRLERDTFMRPDTEKCAVLLQQGRAGPIVGAALMDQF
jgi:hypothetical protein